MTDQVTIKFADGSTSMLPKKQANAIIEIVDYLYDDELNDWNQTRCDTWNGVPSPTAEEIEEDDLHIVHHIAALRV